MYFLEDKPPLFPLEFSPLIYIKIFQAQGLKISFLTPLFLMENLTPESL